MSHLGLNLDKQMAEQVGGIDLILGGHTHHLLEEPLIIGCTTICAAGKFGERIGRVEIGIDPVSRLPRFHASCVSVAAVEEDADAAALIVDYRISGERRMSRVIARLDEALPGLADRESPLGNLLAAGLRRWTDADIGLVNNGQLLGGLAAGDVTEGQLHALCPSPINPCRMMLSGRDLRRALEEAQLHEFTGRNIRGFGFRGSVLGTLAVDGLDIQFDPDRKPYDRILSVTIEEAPLLPDRLYAVGTIDMFSFRIGYESIANGTQFQFYLPEFIRDVLAAEIRSPEAVAESKRRRWRMIPAPYSGLGG
jgi:2',3'-cyclic-nucleotide 2'-phosphodiesterase (5'-nucleotidase family)